MDFGEKMKMLRKQQGLTLEEVGDRVGVGKSTVRKWENGQIANMRRDKIALVAKALGTTPGYLMGWDETDQSKNEPAPENGPLKEQLIRLFDEMTSEKQQQILSLVLFFDTLTSDEQQQIFGLVRIMSQAHKGSQAPGGQE